MNVLREVLRELPAGTFVDVYESDEAYLVVLDVPGVAAEALTVRGAPECVEIRAERGGPPAGYARVSAERSPGVDATVPLPPDARGEGVTTTLDRGILELSVPKADRSGTTGADAAPETAG